MTSPGVPEASPLAGVASPHVSAPAARPPRPVFAEDQEADLWYGGYASRTMLPSFAICAAASVAVLMLLWVFWDAIPSRQSGLALLAAGGGVVAIWLFEVVRWGYRAVALHARLTTRRLFYHRGLIYPRWKVLPLHKVSAVEVRANALERLLRVGRVAFISKNSSEAPVVLEGIRNSGRLAELVRHRLEKGRS